MHEVKLSDVTVAVVCGVVSVDHLLAGYVVLQAAERLREVGGGRATPQSVLVDTEGSVAVSSTEMLDDIASTRALRGLLDGLLQHTQTSTAKLRLCACRPEETGLALLVRELEGALSPLDRQQMKGAVAVLARSTWEAVADGAMIHDDAPIVQDWTRTASPADSSALTIERVAMPLPTAAAIAPVSAPVNAPVTPSSPATNPLTQTMSQSLRPSVSIDLTQTLASGPTRSSATPAAASAKTLQIGAVANEEELRAELASLKITLAETVTDRDRRVALLERDRDRRIATLEADRARRVQEAEDERDRRVREAEQERDRRIRDLEQELSKKVAAVELDRDRKLLAKERSLEASEARRAQAELDLRREHESERAEAESVRAKQIEEAAAKVRLAAEGARDRAIVAMRGTQDAELLAIRTELEMENKTLKERVDELEYALARATTERDAERTLRVDGEVAAANRYRELRRSSPGKPPIEEPRALGYRDVEPTSSDRKWWK